MKIVKMRNDDIFKASTTVTDFAAPLSGVSMGMKLLKVGSEFISVDTAQEEVIFSNGTVVPITAFVNPLANISYDADEMYGEEITRYEVGEMPEETLLSRLEITMEKWFDIANALASGITSFGAAFA